MQANDFNCNRRGLNLFFSLQFYLFIYIIIVGDGMNKKGFTLIELIGVIVILALLTLIIVPNVVTYLQQGISNSKEYQNESIVLGAKNWASDHKDELPDAGNSLNLQLSTLQSEGYIEKNIKDPETGEALDANAVCVVITTENGKKYNYAVRDCS